MRCGIPHPELGLLCDRARGNHPYHSAYHNDRFIDWPNDTFVPSSSPRGRAHRNSQDARTRKTLKDMATRTGEATPKERYFPTENDRLGRAALYLRKYKDKWVSLEELEMKTVAGTAAKTSVSTLINRYGWEIKTKVQVKDGRRFVMLASE